MEIGKIKLVTHRQLAKELKNTDKEIFQLTIDTGFLANKFPYFSNKDRKLSLERYDKFFNENIHDMKDLKIYVGIAGIEQAIKNGKDVFLVTMINPKYSHGQTILNFIQSRIDKGELQYEEPEDNSEDNRTAE